jgi:RNA polymerase sigma-70 factor (ECF subfamily)
MNGNRSGSDVDFCDFFLQTIIRTIFFSTPGNVPDRIALARQSLLSMIEDPSNPNPSGHRSLDEANERSAGAPTGSVSDESLMARVRLNDQEAMTEIFDRYGSMVYSVALRILKDPGQAEDVMQDVFFQLWKGSTSLVQVRGSIGAWLAVVARNRAIDALRRRRPSEPVEDVELPSGTNLASELELRSMMEKVRTVLDKLPVEQRKSVELAFFDGLTHSEIAAKTGDPLGTVKTRIRSALTSLRKGIEA